MDKHTSPVDRLQLFTSSAASHTSAESPSPDSLGDGTGGEGSLVEGAPRLGLVEQVTTPTQHPPSTGADAIRQTQASMNKARRLRSMKHRVTIAAEFLGLQRQGWEGILITFTNRPSSPPEPGQLSRCLEAMKAYCKRRGFTLAGVWVMELHKSGVPHLHALVFVPRGFRFPKPDQRGWWPHGYTRIELARHPVGYLVKYATKGDRGGELAMPKGRRLFGVFGLSAELRQVVKWSARPRWLRRLTTPQQKVARVPFVGWVDQGSGETWLSPYKVEFRWDASLAAVVVTVSAAARAEGPSALDLAAGSWDEPARWQDRRAWLQARLAELAPAEAVT